MGVRKKKTKFAWEKGRKRLNLIMAALAFIVLFSAVPSFAESGRVKVTNEMIYEKLLDVDRRLTVLEAQFTAFKESTDKRFEDINRRFEDMNKRFAEMREDMNKRFDQLYTFLWIITGIFTTIMIAVLGFAYWDRRTIIRQARKETVEYLEREGKIKVLIEVLKERARKDRELAAILRQFNIF